MRDYILEYSPENYIKRDRVRKISLAFSIVLDLVCIALLISAFIEPLYWIAVVLIAILSNTIRYIVNLYPKNYTYGVHGDAFIVNCITPLRTNTIISEDICNIKGVSRLNDDANNKQNSIILYDNSCQNDAYVVEFSDKRVVFPLDEYLYTLLKSGQEDKE